MPKPRALSPGATVRLVTPASPVAAERLDAIRVILSGLGLNMQLGCHALATGDYLAGADADRARDLTDAFMDPRVDCVLCTRGGAGSARLFPYLDVPALAAQGKLF